MKRRIVVVDYGMGNIGSVANALNYLGAEFCIASNPDKLPDSDGLILPGVGAFGAAMENLERLDLIAPLLVEVLEKKKPFLGICLGMQLLAQDSTELGFSKGLGWIEGHVVELEPPDGLRVPQVGWNSVHFDPQSLFFRRIDEEANFYFDHSYHLQCDSKLVAATCEYGAPVISAIQQGNIFAVQFHPEKSQRNGLKLLRNFLNFVIESNPAG